MATNEKRLNVTELDFDNIKANLKTFLKAQSEFKDYDFEGSGMSVLLDVLAYNTHYLGFNANMLANEWAATKKKKQEEYKKKNQARKQSRNDSNYGRSNQNNDGMMK